MYSKELLDKEVVGFNGWKIGKTKDLILDRQNWQITHIDVELRGNIEAELGISSVPLSHKHFPIAISYLQGIGDVITLSATKEQIISTLGSYQYQSQNSQNTQNSQNQIPADTPA